MSELKAICGNEIREDIDYNTRGIDPEDKEWRNYGQELCDTLYYRKSEADKVIADLEESHKKEVGQLLIEIAELKAQKMQAEDDCAYWKTMSRKCADDNEVMAKQRAEAFKRERHQKYKRCLAMARWCESENYTACWYHENSERCKWTEKWRERWLKIAEKFKPNSTAL